MLFLGMTSIAAASFYSLLRNRAWRYLANAAMWAALCGVGYYFWP
jgi:hypothetical protein